MAKQIRLKKEEVYRLTCESPFTCDEVPTGEYIDVPIQDWEINPENINTTYKQGGNVPQFNLDIKFPELWAWKPNQYRNVYFEISVMYQGSTKEWLDFRDANLRGFEFTKRNILSASPEVIFKNLSQLSSGVYTASITMDLMNMEIIMPKIHQG